MPATYDFVLVIISALIAILASYAALGLAGLVAVKRGRERTIWLGLGATAMGTGIWAMHFIAMLAFSITIPINYNLGIVVVSLLAAILASGQALFIVSRSTMNNFTLLAGGTSMGIAIAAMHYIGMAAMQMSADVNYDPIIFLLSVVVAIVVSVVALLLVFKLRTQTGAEANKLKVASAIVMGAAVLAMHYTGMAAAKFTPNNAVLEILGTHNFSVGLMIGAVTFVILSLSLFAVYANSEAEQFQP